MSKWDERFLELARHVAEWSKDPSTKVGAVIVRPDRTVAAIGYNGFPRKVLDHAERYSDRAIKYEMIVHAETNALLNSREDLENHTIYVSPLHPCPRCAAAIIQRGITRVVTDQAEEIDRWEEKFQLARTMFAEAGVAVNVLPQGVKSSDDIRNAADSTSED